MVAQLLVMGAGVFSRAFVVAYQQAVVNAKAGGGAAAAAAKATSLSNKMNVSESLAILNLEALQLEAKRRAAEKMQQAGQRKGGGAAPAESEPEFEKVYVEPKEIQSVYDKYFAANDVSRGGSFYIQSKIFRAKECLDNHLKEQEKLQKEGKL